MGSDEWDAHEHIILSAKDSARSLARAIGQGLDRAVIGKERLHDVRVSAQHAYGALEQLVAVLELTLIAGGRS